MQEQSTVSYSARGVNRERLQAIVEYGGESILDVGCGSGAYVITLADKFKIRGIDYRRYDSWDAMPERFAVADASELSSEDNSVDTILSFETLEHLADPAKALREYHRVCRKNVILTVPNCTITPGMRESLLIYYHWIDRTHVQFFDMQSISELVSGAGFKIVNSYYINQISLQPLIAECFDMTGLIGRVIRKLMARRQTRTYHLTCLLVAEKT